MNIGIDIDDTIVNTYDIFVKLVCMKYGLSYTELINKKLDYVDICNMLKDYNEFTKDLFSILVKSVEVKENVVEVFNKLQKDGHKIILITARNYEEYNDPYNQTYEYLKKNNIPFDKIIVNIEKKDKVCLDEKIDLFIDDNTNHCRDVSRAGINTLQFSALFNEKINEFPKVYSWNQIYEIINCL